jgi:membrane-bound metal-dependent hydrolase YbcI (DUF457 family)
MLGRSHALSGIAVGVTTAGVVGDLPGNQLGWVAVVAGCALAPDLDMAQSTIGRMWGPITGGIYIKWFGRRRLIFPGLSHLVEFLAGGHRQRTHTIDGLIILLGMVYLAQLWTIPTALVLALLTGVGILAADFLIPGKIGWKINLAVSAGVGCWSATRGFELPGWVVWAMVLGCAVHILGDMLTIQGCRMSMIGNDARVRILPLTTGGPVERLLIVPGLLIWTAWVLASRVNPDFPTPVEMWARTGLSVLWLVLVGLIILAVTWSWAAGFDDRKKAQQKKRREKARKSGRDRVDTPA